MVQDLYSRFRGSKFGIFLTLAEPVLVVLLLWLSRNYIRGRMPIVGTSAMLFYASGALPFYLFQRIATRARSVSLEPNRRLPRITAMDVYLAHAALETILWVSMTIAIFFALWMYGIDQAQPANISDCIIALGLLAMMGLGFGMINSVIGRFVPLWTRLYIRFNRILLFASGVFYILDFLPLFLREWLVWSPLIHAVEWFRVGLYGQYPAITLDKAYAVYSAIVLLFVGLTADRATLRLAR